MGILSSNVVARVVVARRVNALRSVQALGPNYEGALPLPLELQGHPATIAGMTEVYSNPAEVGGWLGVIDGGPWIAFAGVDGKALLWTARESNGGVIGDPYVFRRDDLANAPTVTIPNPAHRVADRYLEAKGTGRGWEHRKEKDDFAEQNIPPEHIILWRKLKNRFKGTPHERAEQFMEYLEEHPGENMDALQENADKELAKMTREWEKKRREQVKLEKECDKNQTKYEDAWYKEQERATKEKNNLKDLKEKSEGVCRACPTCDVNESPNSYDNGGGGYDDGVPFAASLRVVARYKTSPVLRKQP